MTSITLRPIDRGNWRTALALRVHPEQQHFVAAHAPIAAIVLAKAYVGAGGAHWTPLLIVADGQAVGLVALAQTPENADSCWLYHFFIDAAHQGHGHGPAALAATLALVRADYPACHALTLTVHPENARAQRLYTAAGFAPTGETIDGEEIYRLALR